MFELTFSKDWVLRKGPVFGLTIEATIEFLSAVGDFDRSLTLRELGLRSRDYGALGVYM